MLSDRSYMRYDYPRETTSALTWILCATLAGAVVQFAFAQMGQPAFARLFSLSVDGLTAGKVWTLGTYVLLHGGILHLVLNGLMLYLIGREVSPLLGTRRFLQFYAFAAALGGLCWFGVHALASGGGQVVGASACVVAMLIFFACVYPEREITFLLFFIVPVTLKPKVMAIGLVLVESLGLIFSELPGAIFPSDIAYSAHLGGALAGWLFFRFFYAAGGLDGVAPRVELPAWLRRRKTAPAEIVQPAFKIDVQPRRDLRAEVDRILDKINSQGFGALTEDEKRVLDDAKDMLSRR